ncbi:hypothetical protein GCM10009716_10360 [Streptomyces sodiiphilus]|uniref:ATP-grasp domain-containing protein n=1 Tax=Streptomyces sodiiphilus TaxID=226217 RepID=A0ABN2NUI2_9ACTN
MNPEAFVLAGSFLAVCRAPAYFEELHARDLKILLITPSPAEQARRAARNREHPASGIEDFAFVGAGSGTEDAFLTEAVNAARAWRGRYRITGVLAAGETQVEPAGLLADALGLPSPGLRASRTCRSKLLQRWYLPEFAPRSLALPSGSHTLPPGTAVPYPAIVKPCGRHSSSGVVSVDGPEDLRQHLAGYPASETVLVEERVIGQEYSVESLVQKGKILFSSVTRKETTEAASGGRSFVELAHSVPAPPSGADAILLDATRRVLEELDFEHGISHAEWRIDATGRPVLMEVAARPPGDGLCVLYHLATGAPLEPEIIRVALGETAGYPACSRYARQIYLEHTPGILREVEISAELPGLTAEWVGPGGLWPRIAPGRPDDPATVRAVLVHKNRGDRLDVPRSSEDRALSVFLDAPDPQTLDRLEQRVRRAVTIHTDPG